MAGCAARAPPGSEARLSLATFLLGASVLALPLLTRAGLQGRTGLALYVAGLNALLLLLYRPPRYQVRPGGGRGGPGRRGGGLGGAAAPSGARPASHGRFPRRRVQVARGPLLAGRGCPTAAPAIHTCRRYTRVRRERAHGPFYVMRGGESSCCQVGDTGP